MTPFISYCDMMSDCSHAALFYGRLIVTTTLLSRAVCHGGSQYLMYRHIDGIGYWYTYV